MTTATFRPVVVGRHRHGHRARVAAPGFGLVRTVARAVINVILALAAITAVSGAVYVAVERIGFAPVLSPSMVPTFNPGDLIVTKSEPAADIRVGQVLSLPIPGEKPATCTGSSPSATRTACRSSAPRAMPTPPPNRSSSASPPRPSRSSSTSSRAYDRIALILRGGIWRIAALVAIGVGVLISAKRWLLDR